MFDVDEFVAECRACLSEPEPRLAVRDLLERTVARGEEVEARLPAARAELTTLHHAADLTVLQVVWAPGMSIWPHDHRMWAAIGIYGGKEDNSFFRRQDRRIVPVGGKEIDSGDVLLLGDDVIHAVHNPLGVCSGALHVYGGDFFGREMSQWHPDTLEQEDEITPPARFFEEANTRLGL
jgi:predicted metal-dependent enzyme (double-stranded beta helix superfamily)